MTDVIETKPDLKSSGRNKRARPPQITALMGTIFAMTLASLVACTGGGNEPKGLIVNNEGKQIITLSPAQIRIYQEAVAKVMDVNQLPTFKAVKAMKLEAKPGVHVCGYVGHKSTNGQNAELPFYIELRQDETNKPMIHRGQVGLDEAKRAKVKFVCRHHDQKMS